MLAKHALSQLSYGPAGYANGHWPMANGNPFAIRNSPFANLVGLGGLEPPTSRLSSARSNQLSYKPVSEDRGRSPPRAALSGSLSQRSPSSDIWEEREAKAAASRKCGL